MLRWLSTHSADSDAAAVLQGHAPLQAALEARLAHLQVPHRSLLE